MNQIARLCFVLMTSLSAVGINLEFSNASDGVIAGWDSNDGRVLLSELKCSACHEVQTPISLITQKQAPNLSKVGSRVTPQYLRAYLALSLIHI